MASEEHWPELTNELKPSSKKGTSKAIEPVWGNGLQTEGEAHLYRLEDKLKSLQARRREFRPPAENHASRASLDTHRHIYIGSSTSPGGSIGSLDDDEMTVESEVGEGKDGSPRLITKQAELQGTRKVDDVEWAVDRGEGLSGGMESHEDEEDNPERPLLGERELLGDRARDSEDDPRSDDSTEASTGSDGPTTSPPPPHHLTHSSPSPFIEGDAPLTLLSDIISDEHLPSQKFNTGDMASPGSLRTMPSVSPVQISSPSPFTSVKSPTQERGHTLTRSSTVDNLLSPESTTRSLAPSRPSALTPPPQSPPTRNQLSPDDAKRSRPSSRRPTPATSPAPSPSKESKHINFAPRVRITSGIRVPIPGSGTGSRVTSAASGSSRVPSSSAIPQIRADQATNVGPNKPQPIRRNTSGWNPLPDFGFGGRSLETASLASSVSVSLRTVPVNTWLFPNSIARALMGREERNGGLVTPPEAGLARSRLPPGPADLIIGDDPSKDYFSINPHPSKPPGSRPTGAGTPGSGPSTPNGLHTPDLEGVESPSSRRSSFSFFSRLSTLSRHTQEEELVEAEAARRRADVMLFNTPYMRSYSSMIRQEEGVSPRGDGTGEGDPLVRSRGKGRLHTVVKIRSEEDVIWGEDRWTKWRDWKWWIWKSGRWWRSFVNFWCAVDEEEEDDGWGY